MPQTRLLRPVLPCALLAALALHVPVGAAMSSRTEGRGLRFVRLLVRLDRHAPPRLLERAGRELGAGRVETLRRLRVAVVRVPRANAAALVSRLRRSRGVSYVERDRVALRITGSSFVQANPSDPLWPQQWGPARVDAPTAWAVTKGSADVVVAVLDTGVDPTQPDLQGALVPGYDLVNNDADPSDDFGHGTAVAGVVAARADNGLGGAGLCPRCSVMPVKVVGADGTATEANVAAGITWATDHGADVVNLSLGGNFGATVAAAVDYATSKGVLVVAAAGNNGNTTPFYPAADSGVLSVAATQSDDHLYSWSNYGPWVAVAAPGCETATLRGGGYGDFCGTSASSPTVAGIAGLARSYAPGASAEAVKQAITSSAHSVSGVSAGRVDAAGTLAALGAQFAVAPAAAPASSAPATAPAAAAPAAPASARLQTAVATAQLARPGRARRHHARQRSAVRRLLLEATRRAH